MGEKDIPPDAGKRPLQAEEPDPEIGKIGTGDDYSGQEYDSPGQAEWRKQERAKSMPADGTVRGSGVGGEREEYDPATSTGAYRGELSSQEERTRQDDASPRR